MVTSAVQRMREEGGRGGEGREKEGGGGERKEKNFPLNYFSARGGGIGVKWLLFTKNLLYVMVYSQ